MILNRVGIIFFHYVNDSILCGTEWHDEGRFRLSKVLEVNWALIDFGEKKTR